MCILFGQAVVNYKCDGRVNIYCDKYTVGEGIRQIFSLRFDIYQN